MADVTPSILPWKASGALNVSATRGDLALKTLGAGRRGSSVGEIAGVALDAVVLAD